MGTNYYIHQNVCSQCGRGDDPVHVGKSSAGWKFAFNGTALKTVAEWIAYLREREGEMQNEYGEPVSTDTLLDLIRSKRNGRDAYSGWGLEGDTWVDGGCCFIGRDFR